MQQGCEIQAIHADTTSRSVQGAFDNQDDPEFEIIYGYSKDHRPDLKQIKIGLGVQQMKQFFAEKGSDFPFILDSSLVTKSNPAAMDKEALQFLSRLPDTFDLNESAKGEAFEKNEWTDVKTAAGKTYRLYETDGKVEGKNKTFYPVVVVYSEELAVKKQKALEKKWAKTHASLQKELDKKAKIAYSCEADAKTALHDIIRSVYAKGFSVKGDVLPVTTQHHSGRGRPKKGNIPAEETTYFLSFRKLGVHPAFAGREQQMGSCFVLISSPSLDMTAEERLLLYKKQIRVETWFRLLKDPLLFHNVYLKNSRRVQSLGYIFYIVLPHLSYLEYRVQRSLEGQATHWIGHGNKKTRTPSVKTIIKEAEGLLSK